jgi:hypothetical protein
MWLYNTFITLDKQANRDLLGGHPNQTVSRNIGTRIGRATGVGTDLGTDIFHGLLLAGAAAAATVVVPAVAMALSGKRR